MDRKIEEKTVFFGKMLKHYRKDAGLEQTDLAKKSGVSQRQISAYENFKTPPRKSTIGKLANALGVTIEQLTERTVSVDHNSISEQILVPVISWSDAEHVDATHSYIAPLSHKKWLIPPCKVSSDCICLEVTSNSSSPMYPAGCHIFVDPQAVPHDGDDVIVCCDHHALFGHICTDAQDGHWTLSHLGQDAFNDIDYSATSLVGVVVGMSFSRR